MFASDYFENGVLNTLKGITFVAPPDVYVALHTSDPTDTGTVGAEVSYAGYARKKITFTIPATESGGIGFKNDTEIKFAASETDSATVTHIRIMDSLVGGNMLLYSKLNEDKPIRAGSAPVLRVSECVYWLTGDLSTAFVTKILNVLRGQSLIGFKPHLTLFNGSPQAGGSELSGGNFGRIEVEFGTPTEGVGGQRIIANSAVISTPVATANLGIFNHDVLYDNVSGGIPITIKAANVDTYNKGDMIYYDIGDLKVGLN